jgi:thiol-disulfide isomerase/thioredoxin
VSKIVNVVLANWNGTQLWAVHGASPHRIHLKECRHVTTLTFGILLQVSLLATDGHNYADAYRNTQSTGKPLVVLVGADWCPGCQTMKNSVIPQLEKQGGLSNVAFAYVNADSKLAHKLMQGGSIPQLIMFRQSSTGWTREQLVGAHSVSDTKSFIARSTEGPPTRLSSRN